MMYLWLIYLGIYGISELLFRNGYIIIDRSIYYPLITFVLVLVYLSLWMRKKKRQSAKMVESSRSVLMGELPPWVSILFNPFNIFLIVLFLFFSLPRFMEGESLSPGEVLATVAVVATLIIIGTIQFYSKKK